MGHLGWLFVLLAPLTCCHILGRPPCKKDEFSCHNRLCIAPHLRCDGVNDCGDGSDEASCRNCTSPDSFSCGPSDACLPQSRLCDGKTDCRDGRDESLQLCAWSRLRPQTSPTCTTSEFQCADGQCIRHIWRCDHSTDCSDGSDEVDCDQNECEVNNGGCSHHCVDQPMGFYCDCPDNMKLDGDSHCEEVDLCLESDVCDQLCVHVNGSFTCDCHKNYQINEATRACEAKGHKAQLVFTSSKGIQSISITGTEYRKLAPHSSGPGLGPGPGPVSALVSNRTLYWAGRGRGSIYRLSMGGKPEDSVLVLKVQGSVSGLAVDWIHQILYWTSPEGGSVSVGLLDGSAQRTLITGLEEPSAVAVEPLRGLLFWAQRGSSPRIQRSRLDGLDRTALVTSLIRHPVALSLDVPRQLLYWVDQGMRTISRVTLEGRHRKTVVESNGYLDRPFGLAVFEGFVYWSDEVTQSICRANKHNGGHLQVLLSNITSPHGVAIVQPVLQPNGPSVCGRTGVVCRHKCSVDLQSESPEFSCSPPQKGQNRSQEVPAISRTVPTSTLSDPTFVGILALIVLLSVLLGGMAVWWWRDQFRPSSSSSLTEQSFSLKESQDLLIGPDARLIQDNLLKPNLDSE